MAGHGLERLPGPGQQADRVRGLEGPAGGVTQECLVRRGRGRMQRVRVREPVFLGQQQGVLALGGLGPLDLGQAAPQILGLGRPLTGRPGQLVEVGPDLAVPLVGPLVVGEDGVQLRPGEPVERLALPARPQQLLLVGLPVHGHQVVGQVGEQRDGDRPAAREGP